MMDKGYITGLTGTNLHNEIEKAMKNGESSDSFDIGHGLIFKSASSWEEIIDADKRGEPVVRRVYTESEKYDNLVQVLEWKPIETAPINEDYPFLISSPEVWQDGVVEVLYDEEMGGFIDDLGDAYIKATHWVEKPKPPRKKE